MGNWNVINISESDQKNILDLFYRTELRENEKIIDNREVTIAKELNIKQLIVCHVITNHLEKKYKNWKLK